MICGGELADQACEVQFWAFRILYTARAHALMVSSI